MGIHFAFFVSELKHFSCFNFYFGVNISHLHSFLRPSSLVYYVAARLCWWIVRRRRFSGRKMFVSSSRDSPNERCATFYLTQLPQLSAYAFWDESFMSTGWISNRVYFLQTISLVFAFMLLWWNRSRRVGFGEENCSEKQVSWGEFIIHAISLLLLIYLSGWSWSNKRAFKRWKLAHSVVKGSSNLK